MKKSSLFVAVGVTFLMGGAIAADGTVLGQYANASGGDYATAVGNSSKATATQSTALGGYAEASGEYSVAVGDSAYAGAEGAVAIGTNANYNGNSSTGLTTGTNSVTIGKYANTASADGISMGTSAKTSGDGGVAIGTWTVVTATRGVALGAWSESTRESGMQGYIPEGTSITDEEKKSGTWTSRLGEASVGYTTDDGTEYTRQVTHVAAGSEDTDAVNVAQLKAVNQRINADVGAGMSQMEERLNGKFDSMQQSFNNRIDTVEKEAQAGIAMAIATAGLPQAYLPGKSMFAMSAGAYRGQTGYALGISHVTESGNWVLKATGSGNSQGHFGGSIGAGYQW